MSAATDTRVADAQRLRDLPQPPEGKDYAVTVWADGFGLWHAAAVFAAPGIGNTGEAERVFANAHAAARRAIKKAEATRTGARPWTLRLEVVANAMHPSANTMQAIEWAEVDA